MEHHATETVGTKITIRQNAFLAAVVITVVTTLTFITRITTFAVATRIGIGRLADWVTAVVSVTAVVHIIVRHRVRCLGIRCYRIRNATRINRSALTTPSDCSGQSKYK